MCEPNLELRFCAKLVAANANVPPTPLLAHKFCSTADPAGSVVILAHVSTMDLTCAPKSVAVTPAAMNRWVGLPVARERALINGLGWL